ncbi:MAG: cytochrome c3 family protein [Desulfurivibrionaceae bacterium]|nr:cytochrome c3 family protein [Desulfobulbales bacterium]MDT8335044.1 cytochrome c3 family protein [Desulfurivibrionaceae bacterium]
MKNHLLRPLWCILAAIALILIARHFMVPDDFGVHGKGFTYGFHRLSNVKEWQDFKVKYRGREYCRECHEEKVEKSNSSRHRAIQCENCHGPAVDHPDDPETLAIDTGRGLCLRCHAALPYPDNPRSQIISIDNAEHNPDTDCSECHDPHNPDREEG